MVPLALAFTGALITRMDIRGFGVVAGRFALASLNWVWARTRPQTAAISEVSGIPCAGSRISLQNSAGLGDFLARCA